MNPYSRYAGAVGLAVLIAAGAACSSGGSSDDVDGGLAVSDGGPSASDGGPVVGDGGAGGCPTAPCDLHEQCGCPEQDACDLEFTDFEQNEFSDQLSCRGILTPGTELSTCTAPSGCAAGYQCISGHCRRYCQDDSVCGGPGGECALTRAGSERTDDRLCTKSCEPDFEADHSLSCPTTFSCYVRFVGSDENRRPVSDCLRTGTVAVNDDCSDDRCGEGLTCITFRNSEGEITSRRCQRRCRVDDQTCPDGSPCEGFSNPTIIGQIEYGYCRSEN